MARLWRASRVEAVGVVCSFSWLSRGLCRAAGPLPVNVSPPPWPIGPGEHASLPLLFDTLLHRAILDTGRAGLRVSSGPSFTPSLLDAVRSTSNWPGLNENDPWDWSALWRFLYYRWPREPSHVRCFRRCPRRPPCPSRDCTIADRRG